MAKVGEDLITSSAGVQVWFRCNRLTLNLKKTEYVYFAGPGGHGVPPGEIRIGGREIRKVQGPVS